MALLYATDPSEIFRDPFRRPFRTTFGVVERASGRSSKGWPSSVGSMSNDKRLADVVELAIYLGVPVKTLYAWRYKRKGPPALRVGRHLRYRWSDIDRWVADQLERPDRLDT